MILTIWRHGQAGNAASDQERELTAVGKADLAYGSRQYRAICTDRGLRLPDMALHSPWLRTTQTARIICEALGGVAAQANETLLPGRDVYGVDAMLTDAWGSSDCPQHVLLVSHQPLVSRMVDHLLGDFGRVPPAVPGGVVTLSLEVPGSGCARLLFWAMPPAYEAAV